MSVLRMAMTDIVKAFKNPKFWILVILGMFFLSSETRELRMLASQHELGIPPFIYPIYMLDWRGRMYSLVLIVMLMSEAPFYNDNEVYVAVRVNRFKWLTGKIMFIVLMSFVFQVIMVAVSALVLENNLGLGNEWGDVIVTYIKSMQGLISEGGVISNDKLLEMSPLPILGYEFLLMVLISIIIGLMTFILNGVLQSYVGTVIMGVVVLLDIYLEDFSFVTFSNAMFEMPTKWIDLNYIISSKELSFNGALAYMSIMILVLAMVCYVLVGLRKIKMVRNV